MPTRPPHPRPDEPILHVDLDAFYPSVEILKDPSLAGMPVVVGSSASRGVVMSASYEARRYGLHSAMPSVRARRLCPEAVFVPPDFESYRAYSNRFREVLMAHTPKVEPLSLDEAFLDVSGAVLLFGSPAEIGARIREHIAAELGLTASVGVARNKLMAKLAATKAKPDGLLHIRAAETLDFLHPLPVGDLWGVGGKTGETLGRLGIRTVGELARTPGVILDRVLGEGHTRDLLRLANGEDERRVVPFEAPKSVSHEETYPTDLDDQDEILRQLLGLSHRVAERLRADGYRARTIILKLRLASFTTLTRSRTLKDPTDLGADLYHVARELFLALPEGRRRFRLLGVGAHGLIPAGAEQLAIVRSGRWHDAELALDRITKRFGKGAAVPAALLPAGPPNPSRSARPRDTSAPRADPAREVGPSQR